MLEEVLRGGLGAFDMWTAGNVASVKGGGDSLQALVTELSRLFKIGLVVMLFLAPFKMPFSFGPRDTWTMGWEVSEGIWMILEGSPFLCMGHFALRKGPGSWFNRDSKSVSTAEAIESGLMQVFLWLLLDIGGRDLPNGSQ